MNSRRSKNAFTLLAAAMLLIVASAAPVVSGDAGTESQQRLLNDIRYLASDELEGRGVGLKGLDLAAEYVREQFARAGLKIDASHGGAFQSFTMNVGAELGPTNMLQIISPDRTEKNLAQGIDFVPQSFGGSGNFAGALVFCGYGIIAPEKAYDDFAGVDVSGRVAMIMRRTPRQHDPQGPFSGRHGGTSTHGELRTKVSNAFDKGAVAILFVNDPYTAVQEAEQGKRQVGKLAEGVAEAALEFDAADPNDKEKYAAARQNLAAETAKYKSGKVHLEQPGPEKLMKFGYAGSEPMRQLPVVHITRAIADEILKPALGKTLAELEAAIDRDLKPQSALLNGWQAKGEVTIERKQAEVRNVIGVLEGAGPTADESIVVGAHYDHVGRGGAGSLLPGSTDIHNGADDNASGTGALLELARRLAARSGKLSRRIVFIAFTGEETGLIGSARYTREPLFPLDKTVAMLNMDMVGRLKDDKLTVFGTGTSSVWDDLLKRLGREYGFELIFKPEGFGPSDHSSFYAKQVPVLHFFTGNHGDYHRPSDDWDKLNIPGEERVVSLIEKLIVDVAPAPARPPYVESKGTAQMCGRGGAPP
ncbi:MAG: M20/M25/M40 family metallo-hydrolase, partial [Planctomycetaceae bacterium]